MNRATRRFATGPNPRPDARGPDDRFRADYEGIQPGLADCLRGATAVYPTRCWGPPQRVGSRRGPASPGPGAVVGTGVPGDALAVGAALDRRDRVRGEHGRRDRGDGAGRVESSGGDLDGRPLDDHV